MLLEAIIDREKGRKEVRDDLWFPGRGFLEQLVSCYEAKSIPVEKPERFQQVSAGLAITCFQFAEDPQISTSQ